MDELNNNEEVVIRIETPTAGEQAVAALVGLGVTLGAYAVLAGAAVVYGKVAEKIQMRRIRKSEAAVLEYAAKQEEEN